jgi:hypothetical protein
MKRRSLLLSCLVPLLALAGTLHATTVLAHGDTKPRHGGVVQLVGETLIELVGRADGVEVYLIDDHDDAVAADYSGRIKVLSGGVTQDAVLMPAGGNKFTAAGIKLAPGARAIVTVKRTQTGASVSARFTIG